MLFRSYLAARDADWMGKIYKFLGLTVGVIVSGQDPESKRSAYACDIVYGTNNEYGFDYLRDNMAFGIEDRVQRSLDFAIVDEVDSILVDEARTPLIISGSTEDSTDLYVKLNQIIPRLVRQHEEEGPGDFSVDEKNKQVFLTEDGTRLNSSHKPISYAVFCLKKKTTHPTPPPPPTPRIPSSP